MKFFTLLIIIIFSANISLQAQDASVEKSLYGIQTGLLGIWAHNETRLADEFALRTEIGFDAGIFGGGWHNDVGFLLAPVINISPRWYYNLQKRAKENRKIVNNSANFLTLEFAFHPNWFVISSVDNIEVYNQISFIPKWGMKRSIGQHFVYEIGAGIGYGYILEEDYFGDRGEVAADLHLRLGYSF